MFTKRSNKQRFLRRLLVEQLEDRITPNGAVVDTTLDVVDPDDGLTSLREAINSANANPGSTVTFDPSTNFSVTGVPIQLTIAGAFEQANATGDLDLLANMTIQGNGAGETIIDAGGLDPDGNDGEFDGDRVFEVIGATVSMSGLTITGGNVDDDGGGILTNSGTLSLSGSNVTGNAASDNGGGIYSVSSTLSVTDSNVTGNAATDDGGGIHSSNGNLTLTRVAINDNTARGQGGGLFNNGSGNLTDVTVHGNSLTNLAPFSTSPQGGGIFNNDTLTLTRVTVSGNTSHQGNPTNGFGPQGAGIFNNDTLSLANVTVSGNRGTSDNSRDPQGGGIFNNDTIELFNVTIVDNSATADGQGGGYYENGASTFQNTLVADNPEGDNFGGSFDPNFNTSLGNNYSNDDSDDGFLTGPGDIVNAGEDARLGPLDDNGGPTQTHALLTGPVASPAIDAGNSNTSLVTDQRGAGFARQSGSSVDIGAFEVQSCSLIVTTAQDVVDPDDGLTSLREAIMCANDMPGLDTITFDIPQRPTTGEPVSWYQAEGNANDSVDGNHGTLENGVTFVPGQVGQAFSLDGVDDYVELGTPAALMPAGGDFTIEGWIRIPEYPTQGTPLCGPSYPIIGSAWGWNLHVDGNGHVSFYKYFDVSNAVSAVSASPISTNTYHHVAGVHTASELFIYVDGVLAGTVASPTETVFYQTGQTLQIGREDCGFGVRRYKGEIDELSFFDRALSAEEIQALSAGVQTIQVGSTGLGALPTITDPVIIDGYTQPGASPNTSATSSNAVLKIELDGSAAGANVSGLHIAAGGSTVRGLVINRFDANGIELNTAGGNQIEGNFIGVDVTGTAALGNGRGVRISFNSPDSTIGGTAPAARNVISGNDGEGLAIHTDGTTVQGNFIGVDATGAVALGNGDEGIELLGSNTLIGGAEAGAGNVISANDSHGIGLYDTTDTTIQGNFIGTDMTATVDLGNGGHGMIFAVDPGGLVGGTAPGSANVIAFNGGAGVVIGHAINREIAVLGNSIFANDLLGIDLEGGDELATGVTLNDDGDADTGPNDLQNYPVLTAVSGSAVTTVEGTLNSLPNTEFRIEFFSNATADPSGFGEGGQFLGAVNAMTDGSGNASFTFNAATLAPAGHFITSTATRLNESGAPVETSEFSAAVEIPEQDMQPGIHGIKWHDLNSDGIQDVGEPGLNGWTFELVDASGTVVATQVTHNDPNDANSPGHYWFDAPAPGTYTVREVLQTGWRQSSPDPLAQLAYELDQEFGLFRYAENRTRPDELNWAWHGEKWLKAANGDWYYVTLVGQLFRWHEDTGPTHDQNYKFLLDSGGNFRYQKPLGGTFIAAFDTTYYHDLDKLAEAPRPHNIIDVTGAEGETFFIEFGNYEVGIHGRKFNDANGNGERDSGEEYLNDWAIDLIDPRTGEVLATTTTMDMDLNGDQQIDPETERGWYWFQELDDGTPLPNGNYFVSERNQNGWTPTTPTGAVQDSVAQTVFDFDQARDFYTDGVPWFDWGLFEEKWFWGADLDGDGLDERYYITADGTLYHYHRDGDFQDVDGDEIGHFDASYYDDISKLVNAPQPPQLENTHAVEVSNQNSLFTDIDFGNQLLVPGE